MSNTNEHYVISKFTDIRKAELNPGNGHPIKMDKHKVS